MKAIRIIAVVLVGLTAVVNLLGGAGTYCAAFTPDKYDSMKALIPLQWLYQLFVVTVVAAGLAGVWTTVTLARVQKNSYLAALIVVAAGLVLALVQMTASRALRGKSMPTDMRLYVSILALLALLILRLPGVWRKAGMDGASGGTGSWTTPAGTAAMVMGLAVLTVPTWVGGSHVFDGANWVYAWDWQLMLVAAVLLTSGTGLVLRRYIAPRKAHTTAAITAR